MITLPWPDARLSPNRRYDRRRLIGIRRIAKDTAWALVNEQRLSMRPGPLELKLTFQPPDRRKRDLDNLYSTFKAYQDGIFEALGLDDSLIARVILLRGAVVVKGGMVIVELSEI